MQLNQLELLSYVTIMHQPVTVSSNTCSQMMYKIKSLLWLVLSLIYLLLANVGIKLCKCARENALFVATYIWLHAFELTVTGWYIIVT